MRNWTEHGFSRLTAISDAGSTPAASTKLRPSAEVCPAEASAKADFCAADLSQTIRVQRSRQSFTEQLNT